MKYLKPPVSISDQVQKLIERGLIVHDRGAAHHYLSNISYYRLRAYTYPYQDNADPEHSFIGKVSIEDVMALYTFDRKLRLLVFDAMEKIEIALRTQIIHQWSLSYGSHWHLDQSLYKDKSRFVKHLSSLQKEINRSKETFIDHYKSKYSQPPEPPCWMNLEVSSMATLSMIFQNLKNCPAKKSVTHHFGLFGNNVLENWIHNFCNIRNICAHHGRLWNRRISSPIAMPRSTLNTFINFQGVYAYKLYPSLAAMVYLIGRINAESSFKAQILDLLATCPTGQLKELGFPNHWENDSFWQ